MDDYKDPFKVFEFSISVNRSTLLTTPVDANDDIIKGAYAAYDLPELGVYAHSKFLLSLAAGEFVRISAELLLTELEIHAVKTLLRRLQDENKIVSLVYGGEV